MRDTTFLRAAALALLLAVSGCGQTGALYLPGDEPPASAPEEESDPSDDDT